MSFNTRLAGVIGALAMLLAGAAIVYAAFTATGTGSGRATAVTAQSITITATACAAADLYPGGPAGAICFTLHNPNPYAVSFNGVAYPSAVVSNSSTCAASNVSIATSAPTTLTPAITVGAGATSGTLSIAGVLQMASTAPNGCQGATFDVPVTLSGTQL